MTQRPAPSRPEVLAPAGDPEALRAAVLAGADAVYFGLQGFNARARATNFDDAALVDAVRFAHDRGARVYVTLNTLVFDAELPALEAAVRACAAARVDAVIVQDLGVARLVRALAPSLPLHASTQMTCTDAGSVALAAELGATRVILARELSVDDIAQIARESSVELEVFVHGALCVAYSGQCLTSEAIGGRSANRGACAQACRLPYELLVDGAVRDLGDRAYLLSPQDLEASALVPDLLRAGVRSLKIEGRLKGPAYVAATTRLYRAAIDAALAGEQPDAAAALAPRREAALQAYSRGSGPGFLAGVNHQALVEGAGCAHRGLALGRCEGARDERGRCWVALRLDAGATLANGDGLLLEGGREGDEALGGRVWALRDARGAALEEVTGSARVEAWLGPDRAVPERVRAASEQRPLRVFKSSDPRSERAVLAELEAAPARVPLAVTVRGAAGEVLRVEARSARGQRAEVRSEAALQRATGRALDAALVREKLGALGGTGFALASLEVALGDEPLMLPVSELKRLRRALVEALGGALEGGEREGSLTEQDAATLRAGALPPGDRAPAPPGLFVLCRTLVQARAALTAGADGVYLDFLELTGTGNALRALRTEAGARFVGVAPPRVRKPGEEKIDRYLAGLEPDAVLVRGLGALHERSLAARREARGEAPPSRALYVGDFSLNVANRLSAQAVLARGLAAFTPSYDLDAAQLLALLEGPFAPWAELVVHHPMPLFHMEHCVFAALLSSGRDHRDCGRPCERHAVSLRDRAGVEHPVEADVGCRNTVFHGAAQSAAGLLARAQRAGVGRFRVELVREDAATTERVVRAYRALLEGRTTPAALRAELHAEGRYGVVRGSLRVLAEA